jgi:F-type H+-transporting ATPase subunit delta
MRGTSQASYDATLQQFDPVATAGAKDGLVMAEQLFAIVDALDSSGSLRRALTDPARPGADKGALVKKLFGQADARVIDIVADAAAARWSTNADLAEALEAAGEMALLAFAESAGTLESVEEELFHVERAVAAERQLLVAMSNRSATKDQRMGLLKATLGGKVQPVTYALLERAVGVPRGRRLIPAIEGILVAAAERRNRQVANVTAAVELSAKQRSRLADILESAYGRQIQINVAVDPQVLGGIRVQVGSEVVDGTVLARLDEARQKLAG